ncbi:reverse transcriptase domain-containing protein [Tanacetum coccineum]
MRGLKMRSCFWRNVSFKFPRIQKPCDQKRDTFWYKIQNVYNTEAKKKGFTERTKNMLTGKWSSMNTSILKFNQLVQETAVHSGENDDDHMSRVHTDDDATGGPTQVDIPENGEREETPEQLEINEHENAHIPAAMAMEIKEMISQEVVKAHAEYFGNIISQTIQEELNTNFEGRVKEVMYSDFSACDPPSYSGESSLFLCHRWIQDVEGTMVELHFAAKGLDVARNLSWDEFKELFLQKFSPQAKLKNIQRDFLNTHQATQQSVHDFSITFLDRVHFLPEYINDQKLLMNHYFDMLKKEYGSLFQQRIE